jgi:hypothetical protein
MNNIAVKLLVLILAFFGTLVFQVQLESFFGDQDFMIFDLLLLKCIWFILGFIVLYKTIVYFLKNRNWTKKQKWIQWAPDLFQQVIIWLWILLLSLLTWRIFWPHGWLKKIEPVAALGAFIIVTAIGPLIIWLLENRWKNPILITITTTCTMMVLGFLVYVGLCF